MFDSVVLHRSVDGPAITAGDVAEAMLFYQNVHLLLDYSGLSSLVTGMGMPTLLLLAARNDVSVTYVEEFTGVTTDQTPLGPKHRLAAITFIGDNSTGGRGNKKKRLQHMLERKGYKVRDAKRMARRFFESVQYKTLTSDHFIRGGVVKAAKRDLSDTDYVNLAAREEAKHMLGAEVLPDDFHFHVSADGEYFRIRTSFDFDRAYEHQRATDPSYEKRTPAHIATTILAASSATVLAGHYGTDFYTGGVESEIVRKRQSSILQRTLRDKDQIGGFQSIVVEGSPSVAEAIKRGDRTFEEFLALLKKAGKFKDWLRDKSPDEQLVTAYLQDITQKSWLNKLPGKSLRYSVGAVVGAIDPVSGLALSAGDNFFLDKMLGGWRPNHFVSKELRLFLDTAD